MKEIYVLVNYKGYSLEEIYLGNIIYVPLYSSFFNIKNTSNKKFILIHKTGIKYQFNGLIEGFYEGLVHKFIILNLGFIKVFSLFSEDLKKSFKNNWIKGEIIFNLDYHYWIFDIDENVKPKNPPNIFYQYKIKSIQEVKIINNNIKEYGSFLNKLKNENDVYSYVVKLELIKFDPKIFPIIASGIDFHMKYLKPDWYK